MPLSDIDIARRRSSVTLPIDQVDFIVYSHDEQTFEETCFNSVHKLIKMFKNEIKNNKMYWIEVINRSSMILPNNIKKFCEYFNIHPLTIEDITTITPYIKLDLFDDQAAIYLLMKIISWNGKRVEQQQISFYLKTSQNILITFQEKSGYDDLVFDNIRNRLRRQKFNNEKQFSYDSCTHMSQMTVDYLFYCLLDALIDRNMLVLEEIALHIDEFDEKLMRDKILSQSTFHSIYHVKHDLLHLRILCNQLKDICTRLQRTTPHNQFLFPRMNPSNRLDMKRNIVRRKMRPISPLPHIFNTLSNISMNKKNNFPKNSRTSIYFDDEIYLYLSDLNDHMDQVIDLLDIQRESISLLMSFWFSLNSDETQKVLEFLMLISVIFMPCLLLTGINSTNFIVQPQYGYEYGYYIVLAVLGAILISMITWYKIKRWI